MLPSASYITWMSVLDTLLDAHRGNLAASLAAAAGISQEQCLECLRKLVPEIASRIREKAEDPEDLEQLFDVLEDRHQEVVLDQPASMLDRVTLQDGEDILSHLYGTLDRARTTAERLGAPRGVDRDTFTRLMTPVATLTLAAMTRRNRELTLLASSGGGKEGGQTSFVIAILSAIAEGIMDGLTRTSKQHMRRRRRTYGGKRKRRRRTSRNRQRRSKAVLEEIIGDLLSRK